MGMYCTLRRVTLDKLESYLQNSHLLEEDFYSNEVTEIPQLDIDKAWDGIIFLLAGNSFVNAENNALSRVILGAKPIDKNQNIGHGPARYLLPEQVKELNEKIKTINLDDLKNRFDAEKMNDLAVYPEIWKDENSFEYLQEYFIKLQSFYQHASWANEAIVIIID